MPSSVLCFVIYCIANHFNLLCYFAFPLYLCISRNQTNAEIKLSRFLTCCRRYTRSIMFDYTSRRMTKYYWRKQESVSENGVRNETWAENGSFKICLRTSELKQMKFLCVSLVRNAYSGMCDIMFKCSLLSWLISWTF